MTSFWRGLIESCADPFLQMGHVVPLTGHRFGSIHKDSLCVEPNTVHNVKRHGLITESSFPGSSFINIAVSIGVPGRPMAPPKLWENRHALEAQDLLGTQPVETEIDRRKAQTRGIVQQYFPCPPERKRIRLRAQASTRGIDHAAGVVIARRGEVRGLVIAAMLRRGHGGIVFDDKSPLLLLAKGGSAMTAPDQIPVITIG